MLPSDEALPSCQSAAIWDSFGHKGTFFLSVHHYTESLLSVMTFTLHKLQIRKININRSKLQWRVKGIKIPFIIQKDKIYPMLIKINQSILLLNNVISFNTNASLLIAIKFVIHFFFYI